MNINRKIASKKRMLKLIRHAITIVEVIGMLILAAFIFFRDYLIGFVVFEVLDILVILVCVVGIQLATSFLQHKELLDRIERPQLSFIDHQTSYRSLGKIKKLMIYTVNTHNIVTFFQQHDYLTVDECIILVRTLDPTNILYNDNDDNEIRNNIIFWKKAVENSRINKLTIIGYNNIPDNFIILFDSKALITDLNNINTNIPSNQSVELNSTILYSNSLENKEVIRRFTVHFNNYLDFYQKNGEVLCKEGYGE